MTRYRFIECCDWLTGFLMYLISREFEEAGRLEPQAELNENGTWKFIETEALKVLLTSDADTGFFQGKGDKRSVFCKFAHQECCASPGPL